MSNLLHFPADAGPDRHTPDAPHLASGDVGLQDPQKQTPPADAPARAAALDTRASFIVEAPAGSGKTGLLVQRFLKLLADPSLDAPEELLAITFTNKATAELRNRILEALESARVATNHAATLPTQNPSSRPERAARSGEIPVFAPAHATPNPSSRPEREARSGEIPVFAPAHAEPATPSFDEQTRQLAAAVLARGAQRGWDLLANPQRLNVRSIDSVCAALANSLPVLSGAGGAYTPLEKPFALYRAAAHRTILHLGGADAALSDALRTLLLHRDANLNDTTSLLAAMLAAREQWGELIPLDPAELTAAHLDAVVRPRLESTLRSIVCAGLTRAAQLMPPAILEDLATLARNWSDEPGYQGRTSPISLCRELAQPPDAAAESLDHWRALIHLLLKPSDGDWRRSFAVNTLLFRPPGNGATRLKDIVAEIESDRLKEALNAVRDLPPARFPDDQWHVTKALFLVLRRALAELKVLFAERGECDFAELSLAARQALHAEPTLPDLALAAGGRLRHLLVDEMQDTSAAQYDLLHRLTRSWDGHTQTLFLVGDPKQSIYLFRQASVERFLRTVAAGALGDLPLTPLQLTANFRSQAALVSRFNETFNGVFPAPGDDALRLGDVPFVEATAIRSAKPDRTLNWHPTILNSAASAGAPRLASGDVASQDAGAAYPEAEARSIRQIIALRRAEAAGQNKPLSCAVLARTRSHLVAVAAELRRAGIPFRGVEIEPLADRQEVLDCLALTRALLHPGDRPAWLAVLRAPWCGLCAADLLTLTGAESTGSSPFEAQDPKLRSEIRSAPIADLIAQRQHLLSPDAQPLLVRAWAILSAALAARAASPLSTLAERTWRSLGGDAFLAPDQRSNAARFFALLRELETENPGPLDLATLDARLRDLYAEPTGTETDVQLMTIHKAKGLQWDLVLVPGLERRTQGDRAGLLNWLELDGENEILIAPIYRTGDEADPLNRWMASIRSARVRAEAKRLFYVACTRAKEEVHLFAALARKSDGTLAKAESGSLLFAAWPAAKEHFDRKAAAPAAQTGPMLLQRIEDSLARIDDELESATEGLALAAAADTPVALPDPAIAPQFLFEPPKLQRLPIAFDPRARFHASAASLAQPLQPAAKPFTRPEGSFAARAFGNVVHRFLELLSSRLAETPSRSLEAGIAALTQELPSWQPRIEAALRAEGLAPTLSARESATILAALQHTLADPTGQWLLLPHPQALSEASFVTLGRTFRADRVFLAGTAPQTAGDVLWIVDFKTTDPGARPTDLFAAQERAKYAAQLESYAALCRVLQPAGRSIRLGLFYPRNGFFLNWISDPTASFPSPETGQRSVI